MRNIYFGCWKFLSNENRYAAPYTLNVGMHANNRLSIKHCLSAVANAVGAIQYTCVYNVYVCIWYVMETIL